MTISSNPWTTDPRQHPILVRADEEQADHDNYKWPAAKFWKLQRDTIRDRPAYRAILGISFYELMPAHWATDMAIIDAETLREYSGPFLFGLRRCGTHLIRLDQTSDPKITRERLDWLHGVNKNFPDTEWRHWDGAVLHRIGGSSRFSERECEELINAAQAAKE